jgi:hypothetical protein
LKGIAVEETLSPAQTHKTSLSAMRVIASTLGAVVVLAGIEHGLFELLQGNIVPKGLVIDAIEPAQKLWTGATEPALTIIPNFLITGISAITIGLLLTAWAVVFVERKRGAIVLLLLSIILALVGGGSPPLFEGVVASVVATGINKPLTWWRRHLSVNARGFLAKLWPSSIIVFAFLFWFAVVMAITGLPLTLFFNPKTTDFYPILSFLGYISEVFMFLAVFVGIAYDTLTKYKTPTTLVRRRLGPITKAIRATIQHSAAWRVLV